jgi:hypothetical protein
VEVSNGSSLPGSPSGGGVDWNDPRLTPESIVSTMMAIGDSHGKPNQALTVSEIRSYLSPHPAMGDIVAFLERDSLRDYKVDLRRIASIANLTQVLK